MESQKADGGMARCEWVRLVQVVCGTMGLPTATVRMRGPDGIARTSTGMGTGPVDAAYKAVDSLVRVQVHNFTLSIILSASIML